MAVLVRGNFPFVEVPVPVGNTAVEGEVGAGETAAETVVEDGAALAAVSAGTAVRFSVLVANAALAGTMPLTRTTAVAKAPIIRLPQKLIVVPLLTVTPQAPLLLENSFTSRTHRLPKAIPRIPIRSPPFPIPQVP